MLKTKFFREDHAFELESKVNEFIKDKIVVNISYSVVQDDGYGYFHCCCVLYNTFN